MFSDVPPSKVAELLVQECLQGTVSNALGLLQTVSAEPPLLEAAIQLKTHSGWTPLLAASQKGIPQLVAVLLRAKADVRTGREGTGNTALHYAALGGHVNVLRLLLGAPHADARVASNTGDTPLLFAASRGQLGAVALLAKEGADMQARNAHGMSPLSVAAGGGHADCLRLLLKLSAEDTAQAGPRSSPFWQMTLLANVAAAVGVAAHAPPSQPVLTLHHLRPFETKGMWMLLMAHVTACHGSRGLRREANELPHLQVSAADKNGHTPLHGAAEAGSAPCLQLLLEAGADAFARNAKQQTPLHIARQQGSQDCIRLLEAAQQRRALKAKRLADGLSAGVLPTMAAAPRNGQAAKQPKTQKRASRRQSALAAVAAAPSACSSSADVPSAYMPSASSPLASSPPAAAASAAHDAGGASPSPAVDVSSANAAGGAGSACSSIPSCSLKGAETGGGGAGSEGAAAGGGGAEASDRTAAGTRSAEDTQTPLREHAAADAAAADAAAAAQQTAKFSQAGEPAWQQQRGRRRGRQAADAPPGDQSNSTPAGSGAAAAAGRTAAAGGGRTQRHADGGHQAQQLQQPWRPAQQPTPRAGSQPATSGQSGHGQADPGSCRTAAARPAAAARGSSAGATSPKQPQQHVAAAAAAAAQLQASAAGAAAAAALSLASTAPGGAAAPLLRGMPSPPRFGGPPASAARGAAALDSGETSSGGGGCGSTTAGPAPPGGPTNLQSPELSVPLSRPAAAEWPSLNAAAVMSWPEEAEAALAAAHPEAAELDVGIHHLAGAGLKQLSMAQLDALESLHYAALATVAERRLELVREQEAQRHAEATRLAGELALH